MLHAVSHHYIHTYPGGLDALQAEQPLFFVDGWISHGSEELKLQFDVTIALKCCKLLFHDFDQILNFYGIGHCLQDVGRVRRNPGEVCL